MTGVDLAKVKPGDLLLVNSQARSARGLYVVLAVGESWISAVPADTFNPASNAKLLPADIVASFRADAVNPAALPPPRIFDLDTPPEEAKVAAAVEAPPQELVRVRIVTPGAEFEFNHNDRPGKVTTNKYRLEDAIETGVDQYGQPWAIFVFEKRDAVDKQREKGEHAVQILGPASAKVPS